MVSEKNHAAESSRSGKIWQPLVVFAILLGLVVTLQYRNKAYESDFGNHPDEAAHVVTGLMVRDYLAGPMWQGVHPMRFAENYYERFPKVALGHYPPGFYAVEGLWMLPSRSDVAVRLFSASLTAFAALVLYLVSTRLMPAGLAFSGSVLFTLLPLVQTYTAIVMSDILLAVFCLLAIISFSKFLSTDRILWSLVFGLFATAAILTKASGMLLVFVPPLAIVFSGKWRVIRSPKLWIAPVPVLILAIPWLWFTAGITEEGMLEIPIAEYIPKAVPFYLSGLLAACGWMLSALLVVCLVTSIRGRSKEKSMTPIMACLWALIVAVLAFYMVVPAGFEQRYLVPLLAPVVVISISGLWFLLKRKSSLSSGMRTAVCVSVGIIVVVEAYRLPMAGFGGAAEAVAAIAEDTDSQVTVLICSDARGEGALTAAVALGFPERMVVKRGTKLLSTSDWLGRGYELAFSNREDLVALLADAGVNYMVIDHGVPEASVWPHQSAIEERIEQGDELFSKLASLTGHRAGTSVKIGVYAVKN